MNVDIQTEGVAMRPEWHRTIDDWIRGCRTRHPDVVGIDLVLRHDARDEAAVVATMRGARVRAAGQGDLMAVALHEALDGLEHELLVHEAVARRLRPAA
jgi:ribosome-associated translation inhibitor RaiA